MLESDSIRLVLGDVEEPLSEEKEEEYATRLNILGILDRSEQPEDVISIANRLNLDKHKTRWHLGYLEARELIKPFGENTEFRKVWRLTKRGREVLE